MDRKMTDAERLALATAAHAAIALRTHLRSELHYPATLGHPDVCRLRDGLREELLFALTLPPTAIDEPQLTAIASQKDPEFLPTLALAAVISWLQALDDVPLAMSDAAITALADAASPRTRQLCAQLGEVLLFGCTTPVFTTGDAEFDRRREFRLLRAYWDAYRKVLIQHGRHFVALTPHPMSRLLGTLRSRIRQGAAILESAPASALIEEALEVPFDGDTLDVFGVYVVPLVARVDELIESQVSMFGVGPLDLTPAEELLIATLNADQQALEAELLKAEGRLLAEVRPHSASVPPGSHPCYLLIRDVELRLRSLTEQVYKARVGDSWLTAVHEALGPTVTAQAEERMAQHKAAGPHELLHFIQLRELCELVSREWNLFQPQLQLRRRDFNALVASILPGRTAEAHNRPPHLWPEDEQDRVKVACRDLLKALPPG